MAIGMARMMGFRLMENFRDPYLATSFTDFWRRWHISLSTWIKQYLYIPLGGSRGSTLRSYFNLCLCFVLCGLWHGPAVELRYLGCNSWHRPGLRSRFLAQVFAETSQVAQHRPDFLRL